MAAPLLIVIQGAPGVGKTTILEKLRHDFTMPMLGKDEIKEFLFDTIPQSDREFSRLQGGVSFDMLYVFARAFLGAGQPVIIEGAFMTKFASDAIQKILDDTGAQYLEIFCYVDETVRQERFRARSESGNRHAAHMDGAATELPRDSHPYMALNLGDRIDVDASEPLGGVYAQIVNEIKQRLTTG
ncbi:MAG TPA: AAA family ATPase [Candidatus Saccharimonadales bacterium]|nr:AAA family ATPase [Candidatus Saccharimonadales bacterium]